MQYLESFVLPSRDEEAGYILSFPPELEMSCYSGDAYPFHIFPDKELRRIQFAPITIFCGGNGSGKSTLLNVISQKLKVARSAPFNDTPCFPEYLKLCRYTLSSSSGETVPKESRMIASDDVFDFLLSLRALNQGVDDRRERLFDEYYRLKKEKFQMRTIDDYEELCRRNDAKRSTKSSYTRRRLPQNLAGKSNGESAFAYFTDQIRDHALYLLDEPENSLSPVLQVELRQFLQDSVRFYGCQFIISTHSPFFLSLDGAKLYCLDTTPVREEKWFNLPNVRAYFDFFESYRDRFLKD